MTGIIFDERAFAIKAIENRDLGAKPKETLTCLVKYYRDEGYKKKDIRAAVTDFIQSTDSRIDIHKWETTVERYTEKFWKSPTSRLADIPVTQKELDAVTGLPTLRYRRLMFALICFAKFADLSAGTNYGWINRKYSQVFQLCNVHICVKEQCLAINALKERGLISLSRKVGKFNIKVECIDWEGDPVLHVDDLRNIGYYYSAVTGDDGGKEMVRCKECGIYVPQSKNHCVKYCPECARIMNIRLTSQRIFGENLRHNRTLA